LQWIEHPDQDAWKSGPYLVRWVVERSWWEVFCIEPNKRREWLGVTKDLELAKAMADDHLKHQARSA
jgi:hypothetical protein